MHKPRLVYLALPEQRKSGLLSRIVNIRTGASVPEANAMAATKLTEWLELAEVRNVLVAGGNSPLDLYGLIAERPLSLCRLRVFALDEYVGVPLEEPRNCANLMRRRVVEAWQVPETNYFTISSLVSAAAASVQRHERLIQEWGGLDVAILGLGQNGHLGFNEPGSAKDAPARVVHLNPISVEANRQWFSGDYAPAAGATVGLGTLLAARRVLVLAFGPHKTAAVRAMAEGEPTSSCPASFLQDHPNAWLFLDAPAAAGLNRAAPR